MNFTDPFVLRNDVLLIPCTDLSEDLSRRITFDEGDYTLSRRYGRALAQVIDGGTAALLELFRQPRTIADAVFENSLSLGKDPELLFDELVPHIGRFVHDRVLVPVGSEEEKEIRPRFESGARIAGYTVVRCAGLVEDREVYQVRRGRRVAALKIARDHTPHLRRLFDNEAAILRHLGGSGVTPRLLEAGLHDGRPYLVLEWIAGVHAGVAAANLHHDRCALIELCGSIVAAYATLHEHGVVHGDVHEQNMLVDGRIRLLDFGYARFADREPSMLHAAMSEFYEPEFFAAEREGRSLPASEAGEQYAVAALLYLLITGKHYLDFRLERKELTRQIETEPPLSFAARGLPPWPEVERILFRALEKEPARRHASMAEMAALLENARKTTTRESLDQPLSAETRSFLDRTLQALAPGGETYAIRYPVPPTASINYGCAGAAAGLFRIAEVRGDPKLLALAAVWESRAAALIETAGAYDNADDELTPELLGQVSPYHTEAGIHAVAAMIAAARGYTYSQISAIEAFLKASSRPCSEIDITLGRLGTVLAASLLLDISHDVPEAAAPLRGFASETLRAVWNELDARPAIDSSVNASLGMAHGWAGYLYATMRWCSASGDPLPARLIDRLHQLAALKTIDGRGAYWPSRVGAPSTNMPGWCSGSAGQLFTFLLAYRLLRDDRWLRLAECAAWHNWDQPRGATSLCCGTAGRAYALLALYRATGDRAWVSRARELANHAARAAQSTSQRENALWKGELGVAVLIADLESPENARMPFFE